MTTTTITTTLAEATALTGRGAHVRAGLAALALAALFAGAAAAQDAPGASASRPMLEGMELSISPYTYHFHPSDEHEYVYAIGLLKRLQDRWIVGGSYFSNSFGQPSAYVYVGQRYDNFPGFEQWYLQWNVGILYGYVGEYKDKVPFNYKGFSPGFVPSIGYRFTDRIYGELDLLGNSALMFTLVFPLSNGW